MKYVVTIEPRPATGNGDIDGFTIRCSCGDVASSSLRVLADEYRRGHLAWHERTVS